LFGVFSTIGYSAVRFLGGPLCKTMVTVPEVVGSHVILKGVPAGTCVLLPGVKIAFPKGPLPCVVHADTVEAAAARTDRIV